MAETRLVVTIACVWAAGLLGTACAHRPPPTFRSTHLIVQRSGWGFRAFVRAKVAGQPMTLLLDTGAFRSILPAGFVRAHGLPSRSANTDERMVDANGNAAHMAFLPDVPVQFEGESSVGTLDFLMNSSEDTAEGILVPQDIVRPGWVLVIDLEREELRYELEESALKRLGGESPPLREVDFHRCLGEGPFERAHRVVSTSINGVSADMLVDTGASRTFLARNNPVLPSMLSVQGSRETTVAITSRGQGLRVDDVSLLFSKTWFVLPVYVLPASMSCGKGALGADVLRHCTLVWGWSSLWAACHPPTESGGG